MKNETFFWLFPSNRFIDSKLFPDEWVCPKKEFHLSSPADVIGRKIVLLKAVGANVFIFGIIEVEAVAEILDGAWEGDFVVYSNRKSSIRILPFDSGENMRWKIEQNNLNFGIVLPTNHSLTILQALFDKNRRYSFSPKLIKPAFDSLPKKHLELGAMAEIIFEFSLRTIPFGDVEFSSPKNPISSYATFTIDLLTTKGYDTAKINSVVLTLDEKLNGILDILKSNSEEKNDVEYFETQEILVDVGFREIEADKIFARCFFTTNKTIDLGYLKDKTEIAEARHQAILKDIVIYLSGKSYYPLDSRSIDFAIKIENTGLYLFEIKTSTISNIVRQAEHGIIQLLRYKLATIRNGWNVLGCGLIIENNGSPAIQNYIQELSQSVNIKLFYYNSQVKWPERIPGIINFISSYYTSKEKMAD